MNRSWSTTILVLAALVLTLGVADQAVAQNNVTFQVNMAIKMQEQSFLPASGDSVSVAGNFNGWNTTANRLTKGTLDSIYSATVSRPTGDTILYKYFKTLRGGLDWEGGDNKMHVVQAGDQTVPLTWFDGDSVFTPPSAAKITFQVNMSIKMREGSFLPGSGDIVRVAGSFNNWGSSTDTLVKGASDSIYSKTIELSAASIQYKFLKNLRGGLDWENVSNRPFTVTASDATIPVVWFDDDSVYNAPTTDVNVKFQVNMSVKMKEFTFLPDSGDVVTVSGGFNGWGWADTLAKGASDSIWSKTIKIASGSSISYKFLKTKRGGLDWENVSNRAHTVALTDESIAPVWFDDDSVVNTPITANVLWEVDMSAWEQLGWFDPAKDQMQVRGGFEGWGGTLLTQDFFNAHLFNLSQEYSGTSGDQIFYKFYNLQDSATAFARWGTDYNTNKDGYNYEHPSERGDGNLSYSITSDAFQGPKTTGFSQIAKLGLFNATDSTNITFTVNMGPAKRYSNAFVPATDTVKVLFGSNRLWLASQWKSQGLAEKPENWVLSPKVGGGDSIYTVTMKVKGKTHYGVMYQYGVYKSDGTSYTEGGGLGVSNPYRSRFIRNGSVGAWGSAYSFPQDEWQKDPPMVCETALYTDAVKVGETQPLVYSLSQNYPNPFNPTTTIKFTVPAAGIVTLKVFNILGQEVATLAQGMYQPGTFTALFEARNLSSGVYFYRMQTEKFTDVKKMMLLK
jgi:hypothetical protein